jgi:hypothetical protein
MRYEVQYSSYVNVTNEGFVLLKRIVKTESFALQVSGYQSHCSSEEGCEGRVLRSAGEWLPVSLFF